jgi:hypothetical protein
MNNNYLIEKYSFLSKNLCNIFKNINNDIIEYLPKNVKTRKGKINYNDVFYYKMLYTFKNKTKQEIVSSINCNNNKNIDRTTFHKKDLKMNIKLLLKQDLLTQGKHLLAYIIIKIILLNVNKYLFNNNS